MCVAKDEAKAKLDRLIEGIERLAIVLERAPLALEGAQRGAWDSGRALQALPRSE